MWWRLTVLWAVVASAVYFLFFFPIETHAVKLDMPSGARLDAQQDAINMQGFLLGAEALVLLVILGICIWLSLRAVRRYRKSS